MAEIFCSLFYCALDMGPGIAKYFHDSSRTTRLISTKFGTKHPWVKGIQFGTNEGPLFFSRGDNNKIAKVH